MTMFPYYHDALTVANLKKGQLPFYVLDLTIDSLLNLHHHDFAEFFFVYEGKGVELINGNTHTIQPGSASFLLPHHLHEIQGNPATPIRMYCCMFDISVLFGSRFDFELAGRLLQTGNALPSYVDFDPKQSSELKQIFASILHEYSGSGFGKFSFIRIKLLEALLLFARTQQLQPEREEQKPVMKKTIWNIVQFVHMHYADKLTLEKLSQQYKVSAPYISYSFKKFCGQSFLEYLQTLRINSALSLLLSTEMSVSDVAAEVGFDSYRNFSRVFKKMRGLTPGEYRERHQAAEPMPIVPNSGA